MSFQTLEYTYGLPEEAKRSELLNTWERCSEDTQRYVFKSGSLAIKYQETALADDEVKSRSLVWSQGVR